MPRELGLGKIGNKQCIYEDANAVHLSVYVLYTQILCLFLLVSYELSTTLYCVLHDKMYVVCGNVFSYIHCSQVIL